MFVFIFCSMVPAIVSAQEQFIEGFKKLAHMDPIYDEEGVAGYFCLFETGKAGNGKVAFRLDLFDENLSLMASKPFVHDKNLSLAQSASTGNSLLLLFADAMKNLNSYLAFDYNGEQQAHQLYIRGIRFNKYNRRPFVGLNGRGFLNYSADPGICSLKLIPDRQNASEDWQAEKKVGAELYNIEYLASNEAILLSTLVKFSGGAANYSILGTNLDTGEELFETGFQDSGYAIQISNGWFAGQGISLFGLYYDI